MNLYDNLIKNINAKKRVPSSLFKGGRIQFILRILYGVAVYIESLLVAKNKILFIGKGLYSRQGKVQIRKYVKLKYIVSALKASDPFIVVHTDKNNGEIHELTNLLDDSLKKRYHKPHIFIFEGLLNGEYGILHISGTINGKTEIIQHNSGLMLANKMAKKIPHLNQVVPKRIKYMQGEKLSFLAQTKLKGERIVVNKLSENELMDFMEASLIPLKNIYHNTREDTGIIPDGDRISSEYTTLLHNETKYSRTIYSVLSCLQNWKAGSNLPGVFAHGDYKLENLLFNKNHEVVGIVDWANAHTYGIPGYDAFSLLINAFYSYRCRRQPVIAILGELWTDSVKYKNNMYYFIDKIKYIYDLDDDDVFYISLLFWLEEIKYLSNSSAHFEKHKNLIMKTERIINNLARS